MARETLDLSDVLDMQPVRIGNKDYELWELDGADRDKWLSEYAKKMRTTPDGRPVGIKDFSESHSSLLSICMCEPGKHDSGERVPSAVIQKWPAKTQAKLFKIAQEMSGLGEEATKQAKND